MRKLITMAAIAAALCTTSIFAELKLPRVSQMSTVSQTVGLTDVTITYSRPGVKGRTIWGGLVPYDQVWRTGANEATTFAVSDDVTINGQKLPAGKYSLHTIPGKDQWTIIFNTVADQWGSYSYDQKKDALRVTVKPEAAPFTEWLTFDIPQVGMGAAEVDIRWENLRVPFKVEADTTNKVLTSARSEIAAAKTDDWRTPYSAANFAFTNSIGSKDEVAKWLDQSIRANENYSNLSLRAKMLAAEGKTAAAITTGEKAIALGKASEKKVDTTETEKFVSDLKSKK